MPLFWFAVCMVCLFTLSGCYYSHLASGQVRVLWARRSVDDVLADPSTTEKLRGQLQLAERVRVFARELGLRVDGQYTSYVPWPGDRIVTSLIVTLPGRIEPRPFRFPIIGEVPYKGFFDLERAEAEAERFAAEGMSTCLVAVSAYSTLGFFDDPLTDPMLESDTGRLVETILHELVHATVFIKSEPNLNEGAAHFIGEEASVRFFADQPERAGQRRAEIEDDRLIALSLMQLHDQIAALYDEPLEPDERKIRRRQLEVAARADLATLPITTRRAPDLADHVRLGDACLALRGAYWIDTPRHAALLDELDGDLSALVARLVSAAKTEDPRTRYFDSSATPAD